MKITLEPRIPDEIKNYLNNPDSLHSYVTVTMEDKRDDLSCDQAVALVAKALIAFGYCEKNIANALHPDLARELFGSSVVDNEE